jgi:hypothetical protein
MISIPEDKIAQAKEIMKRIDAELEEDSEEGCVGYVADVKDGGVWIRSDESINTDHAESLVKALVEELDLPGIFVCSWSCTCSKLRIDEFGGGAFAVQKGCDTIWVDAASEALRRASISETNVDVEARGK